MALRSLPVPCTYGAGKSIILSADDVDVFEDSYVERTSRRIVALVRFFTRMSPHMPCEIAGRRKSPFTHIALVRFLACVHSVMHGQVA